nr:ribonuclease H-like domain-containing protein [Tanacetum cinerariifolium]
MRPFGYPITILNTKYHLGKFDGKADEGFFIRYSLNSKAFRVFNSRTRIVEENLHIRFNENTPNVVGSGPDWLFDIDALTRTMNYDPIVTEKEDNVNITNTVNAAGINRVNTVGIKTNNELPFDLKMPALEDISIFNFSSDHEDDNKMADMNNLNTTIQGSPNTTTIIHKDHPLDQMDVKSAFLYGKIEQENMFAKHWDMKIQTFLIKCTKLKKHYMDYIKLLEHGELTFFLGLEVKQKQDGIFISRDKYVTKILKKYRFTEVKNASTTMETKKPLLKDEDGEEVDVHMYRSMIGSLMYLTSSRPDIMFAAKTVIGEVQLQALVDGKKVIITESTIRRDLQLEDAKGVDCLPNAAIFEKLTLIGVKNLEKKQRLRTYKIKRLYKVGLTARVDSSDEASLGKDASKQEMIINDINADKGITLVDETAENQGRFNDQEDKEMLFDVVDDLRGEEVFVSQEVPLKEVNDVDEVNDVSTTTTTTVTIDDITLAKALIEIKSAKTQG